MSLPKKQLKISKMFRKGRQTQAVEDCDDLQDEIKQLELKLREKRNELFQIQRNKYRCKVSPPKKRENAFIRPQKIVLSNSIESIKRSMELMTMLTSMEVQSYVSGEHCCVLFHMQHDAPHEVKHGIRIDMTAGVKELASRSLPLGFNMSAITEDFDNVMNSECLGAIRKGLVAYYDRLEQFQVLKKYLSIEADLFKTLDGSHIEISFLAEDSADEEEEQFRIVLMLDYRVYDIRPKTFAVRELDLPESAAEVIRDQCAVFKKMPLMKAFKEAFVDGAGRYRMAEQQTTTTAPRRAPAHHHAVGRGHYDDTFRPDNDDDIDSADDN